MSEPITAEVDFNLNQLRIIAKSISRSLDAEAKKLERLRTGTHVHSEVAADYAVLDSIDAEIRNAMHTIIQKGMR